MDEEKEETRLTVTVGETVKISGLSRALLNY